MSPAAVSRPPSASRLDPGLVEYSRAVAALGPFGLTLGQVDGLLASVLTAPAPIPTELWLTALWIVEEGDPEPDIDPQAPEVAAAIRAILERCGEIALELEGGGLRPLYDVDEVDGSAVWETWADGFKIGMTLNMEAWGDRLLARSDFGDAARLMVTLIELAGPPDEVEELVAEIGSERAALLRANAHDLLIECVLAMHAARPRAPIVRRSKTGRNEPCPCGSGRKFKTCCGAPAG